MKWIACYRFLLAACLALTWPPAVLRAQAQPRAVVAPGQVVADQLIGVVIDVVGKPMPDIEVYLARTSHGVRTDARGVWRIANPPTGAHVVVARAIGYVPYVREVLIGSAVNDTVSLLLRRYPRTLSTVEVTARSNLAMANAAVVAERLTQLKVGAGRLYTREQILEQRPYSVAELIQGIPGLVVRRGQGEITATTTRFSGGVMVSEGQACPLQFYVNDTPIENDGVAGIDPLSVRSVEVYPQTVLLPGLPVRSGRCGAIVINLMRR